MCRRLRPTARQDPGPAVPVAMCSRGSGAAAARVGVPQSSVRVTPQPVHAHLPAGAPRDAHAGVQTELLAAAELGATQECPQGWLPVTDTRASQREELQVTQGTEDRSPGDKTGGGATIHSHEDRSPGDSRRGQPLHNHIHLRLKEVFGVAGLGEHAESGGIPGVWAQGGCRW